MNTLLPQSGSRCGNTYSCTDYGCQAVFPWPEEQERHTKRFREQRTLSSYTPPCIRLYACTREGLVWGCASTPHCPCLTVQASKVHEKFGEQIPFCEPYW